MLFLGAERRMAGRNGETAGRMRGRDSAARKGRAAWVFGYGSLMWDPGFPFLEARPARLTGFHRALCIYSRVYRGTPEAPGLVVGLERGGSCLGRAFRIERAALADVLAYLDERELIGYAYRRALVSAGVGGRTVRAWAYVADRRHAQYAGRLPPRDCVKYVRQGRGVSGSCLDYLESMLAHLETEGIEDRRLKRVLLLARGGAALSA